jgi:tether containing UBX domain for GLUT4
MEQEPPSSSKNIPSAKEKETAVNVNANRPEATSAVRQPPAQTLASGSQQPTITPRIVELHCQRGDFHILGPNDAIVYHADDVALPEFETPPDDFYEVTVRDVESIYRSLKQKRAELEEAPLQISTKRAEERDNYVQTAIESHPTTIVRVRFPDRFVLQGTFRSTGSLAVIYDFVRQYLRNNRQSFYLFTVPPKKVLSESSTLVEENLIGYAVIYYGSQSTEPPILTGSVKVSDPERVFHYTPTPGVGLSQGGRNVPMAPAPAPQVDQTQRSAQPGSSRGPTTATNTSTPRSSAGRAVNSNVVPKWFKK